MARQIHAQIEFTGGINDSLDDSKIQDNELKEALNCRVNLTGNVVSREGQVAITAAALAASSPYITGAFEGILSTGTAYIIASTNSSGNQQTFHSITSGNTVAALSKGAGVTGPLGNLWRWVIFNDVFIGTADFKATDSTHWPVSMWNVTTATVNLLSNASAAGITAPSDIALWNKRLCISQSTDLYISDAGTTTTWQGGDTQVFKFRGAKYGEELITAIYPFRGELIVFKENSIFAISPGTGVADSFEIRELSSDIGCVNRHTIQDIGRDLLFLSTEGVNSLQDIRDKGGLAVSGRISQKIYRTLLSQIPQAYIDRCVSAYNPSLEEYLLAIPATSTDTENTAVLVLNTYWTAQNGNPSWFYYEYTKNPSIFCRRISNNTLVAGNSDGNLYKLNDGTSDLNQAFTTSFTTKRYYFGSIDQNNVFNNVILDLQQGNSYDVTVNVRFNGGARSKIYSVDLFASGSLWDVATWDVSEFGGGVAGISKRGIYYVARDVQISVTNNGQRDFLYVNKVLIDYEPIAEAIIL